MKKNDSAFDQQKKKKMADLIRFLSIDAVEKANSGHPGMPMGIADVATVLFNEFLKFNPQEPKWADRDRFILSAGHGSILLYSLLYLVGYEDIKIDDIKKFRQLHSKTAGHPEYGEIKGIETTTGPLGQGLANAVGMAIAEKMLKARFGNIVDHKTYCIVGDGCLMEGISYEAISIAGHLGLSNLIVLWDNNSISIDGSTNLATSENMKMRFESCNWNVIKINGHNFDEIRKALKKAQKTKKPTLIDCKTLIGYGSPGKSGSEKCHGSPLGSNEVRLTRNNLDWQYGSFEVPDELLKEWRESANMGKKAYKKWLVNFEKINPELKVEFNQSQNTNFNNLHNYLAELKEKLLKDKPIQPTRKSSGEVLEVLTKKIRFLAGGSADLTGSVNTKTSSTKSITKSDFSGNYIHYGVREHSMAAIMNGIALHKGFIPYSGTFLVFSDYMKPAIRLSSLMRQQVIYILTHDSIGLGEDGPTHQPIEHLAMLRAIPNLNVFRPADALEVVECFEIALQNKNNPSAMILSRQNVNFYGISNGKSNKGGYILFDSKSDPDVIIIATGSEVEIAVKSKEMLEAKNIATRVVSMPCFEIFEQQTIEYKSSVLGSKDSTLRVGIEAALEQGWERYLGNNRIFIGMSSFGASGKAEELYKHFKITSEVTVQKIVERLSKSAI